MAQTEEFFCMSPTFEAWLRVLVAWLEAVLGTNSEGLPKEELRQSYQRVVDPADVAAEIAELAQQGTKDQ